MSLLTPGRLCGILALVAGVAACMGDDDDPLTSGAGETTSSSSGGRSNTPPPTSTSSSSSSSSGGTVDASVPETGGDDAATDAQSDGAHDS